MHAQCSREVMGLLCMQLGVQHCGAHAVRVQCTVSPYHCGMGGMCTRGPVAAGGGVCSSHSPWARAGPYCCGRQAPGGDHCPDTGNGMGPPSKDASEWGEVHPPSPSKASNPRPATVSLTPSVSFNAICDRQQPLPTALVPSSNHLSNCFWGHLQGAFPSNSLLMSAHWRSPDWGTIVHPVHNGAHQLCSTNLALCTWCTMVHPVVHHQYSLLHAGGRRIKGAPPVTARGFLSAVQSPKLQGG